MCKDPEVGGSMNRTELRTGPPLCLPDQSSARHEADTSEPCLGMTDESCAVLQDIPEKPAVSPGAPAVDFSTESLPLLPLCLSVCV